MTTARLYLTLRRIGLRPCISWRIANALARRRAHQAATPTPGHPREPGPLLITLAGLALFAAPALAWMLDGDEKAQALPPPAAQQAHQSAKP